MVILALLLILLAAVLAVGIIVDGTEPARLEVFGLSASTTGAGIYIAGLATMLAFLLGVWMLQASLARARRKRREVKSLRHTREEEVSRLEQEKAELAARLEREKEARSQATVLPAETPVRPGDAPVPNPGDDRNTAGYGPRHADDGSTRAAGHDTDLPSEARERRR